MAHEEHTAVLDEMSDAAREGRELARELMRFAQYESLVVRRVEPAAVFERVRRLGGGMVVSGVRIVAERPNDLPPMASDVDELAHALLQLVVNARDALPEGGTITLSGRAVHVGPAGEAWPGVAPGDYVCLTVSDNGKGMDAATRERAFEPFSGRRPLHEAPGVGLPVVYGIMRAHKGAVRIDSTPGQGTAVNLLVPCWKEPVAPSPSPAVQPAGAAPGSLGTVLVVDDEAIIRHAVRRALTRFGYRVLEAETADAAVAQLAAAEPPVDLVLLDIVIPGGARRAFREMKEGRRDLPIVLSSGFASQKDETIQALLAAGALGLLRKPYEVEELRRTVADALGQADD